MSKIAKNPITIPAGTTVSVDASSVRVKGPKGELMKPVPRGVLVSVESSAVVVKPANNSKLSRSLWGTYAAHVKNMLKGVQVPFEKKLSLEGIGYKVELQGKSLKFNIGFSHPVLIAVPEGIEAKVEKNLITLSGTSKDLVGQFAADVRVLKKPEPYKGKGIRYVGEVVRQKQGKKAVG
jgi:large subunit ribosomal protein L6